jgi:hypothetical protein
MKKKLWLPILCAVALFSCIHGTSEKRGIATMFYAHSLDDVFSASKTVLKDHDYEITEINKVEDFIKAKKGTRLPGMPITVTLSFQKEGDNSTWIEIEKYIPPQPIPGSMAGYRMDVDDLFRYIESELDRNY